MSNIESGPLGKFEGPRIWEARYTCYPPQGTTLPRSADIHPNHTYTVVEQFVHSERLTPEIVLSETTPCPLDPSLSGTRLGDIIDLGSPNEVVLPPESNTRYWLGIK